VREVEKNLKFLNKKKLNNNNNNNEDITGSRGCQYNGENNNYNECENNQEFLFLSRLNSNTMSNLSMKKIVSNFSLNDGNISTNTNNNLNLKLNDNQEYKQENEKLQFLSKTNSNITNYNFLNKEIDLKSTNTFNSTFTNNYSKNKINLGPKSTFSLYNPTLYSPNSIGDGNLNIPKANYRIFKRNLNFSKNSFNSYNSNSMFFPNNLNNSKLQFSEDNISSNCKQLVQLNTFNVNDLKMNLNIKDSFNEKLEISLNQKSSFNEKLQPKKSDYTFKSRNIISTFNKTNSISEKERNYNFFSLNNKANFALKTRLKQIAISESLNLNCFNQNPIVKGNIYGKKISFLNKKLNEKILKLKKLIDNFNKKHKNIKNKNEINLENFVELNKLVNQLNKSEIKLERLKSLMNQIPTYDSSILNSSVKAQEFDSYNKSFPKNEDDKNILISNFELSNTISFKSSIIKDEVNERKKVEEKQESTNNFTSNETFSIEYKHKCNHCEQRFKSQCAKGGHTKIHHKGLSKNFKMKKEKEMRRKPEKEILDQARKIFFENIIEKIKNEEALDCNVINVNNYNT